MKTWKKRVLQVGLAVFGAIQVVRCDHTNPPESAPLQASDEVQAVLARACFDCHSNRTHWPWYSQVAPVSWLVQNDVVEGRRELNFSSWEALPERARAELRHEAAEQVTEGEMPLWFYVPLHPKAKLGEADVATLVAWSREGAPAAGSAR